MNKCYIGDMRMQVPAEWNELNRWQLLEISRQIAIQLPRNEILKRVALILIEAKKHPYILWFLSHKCSAVDRAEIDVLGNFIFEKKHLTKDILSYIPNPGSLGKLYGPGDNFKNCSFYEIIKAHAFIVQYEQTKEEKYLNLFVAALYRPKKWFWEVIKYFPNDGDIRQSFNDHTLQLRANRLKKLSLTFKTPVIWYFKGCMESIIEKNPDIFPNDEKKRTSNYGWSEALISLSGNKYGDIEQTAKTKFHTILLHMKIEAKNNSKK